MLFVWLRRSRFGLVGFVDMVELAFNLELNAANSSLQGTDGFMHALELSGMGITTNLCSKPWGFPVVVLA